MLSVQLSVCGRLLPRFNPVSVFDLMQYAKTNHIVFFRMGGEGGGGICPLGFGLLPLDMLRILFYM